MAKKLPAKYKIKGFSVKYYKSLESWRKAIKPCQNDKHKGWLWDIVGLFRSRVCKQCKIHFVMMIDRKTPSEAGKKNKPRS